MPITFSNIGMEEPSTITNRAAAVTIARGSTNEQQEILCIGDGQSSLGVAVVTDAAPASTAMGLVVRVADPSTGPFVVSTGSVRVHQSTAADLNVTVAGYSTVASISTGSVRVHQSTAADLNVTVAGYVAPSTVTTVSTGSVRVHQSTAADLQATVGQASTTWAVQISGTVATAEALPSNSTFISGSKGTSGDTEIISSATTRIHVYGYIFSMASTTPTTLRMLSGSTNEMGRWFLQGPSSVSIGANMAVPLPGYLFRTGASVGLTLNTDSTATVHYSVMAYRA